MDKDNIYSRDAKCIPEVKMIIGENGKTTTLTADPEKNEIFTKFDVAVINNRTRPVVIRRRINGQAISQSKLTVEPIILEHHIPKKIALSYDFGKVYDIRLKRGIVPAINFLLKNDQLYERFPIAELRNIQTSLQKAEKMVAMIKDLNESDKTKNEIRSELIKEVLPVLKLQPKITMIAEVVDSIEGGGVGVDTYLKAMQLLLLFHSKSNEFKINKEYAEYVGRERAYNDLFASLKNTWQDIKPKKSQGKLFIEIPNVNLLSNGERDIIVFLAMLEKARLTLKKKENILIIDEVFDYLDDANLVAAQYYISEFISKMKEDGKEIFPIILTHLNPDFYKHYAFKDLKVYYLLPLPYPHKSNLMMSLLRRREELGKNGVEDVISTYMLHYHVDYKKDMSDVLNQEQKDAGWGAITKFKEYCKSNVEHYLENKEYCPLAVCVMLREWIEGYCYEELHEDCKEQFLKKHGTQKKLNYAEENGIEYPEIFSLLGLIYNNPLHATDKKDLRQTLYSRLQNNTIRAMIANVKELCKPK